MKRIALFTFLVCLFLGAKAETVFLPADDGLIIPNPERGMMTHHEFFSDRSDELDLAYLDSEIQAGRTLIFTVYVLRDFRDKELSKSMLGRIRRNFRAIRRAGMKAIVRFCYSYSEDDHPWDAPWEVTSRHIEQLTPILRENADVIAVLEAGFIGVWGEWYYTDNHVYQPDMDKEEDWTARRRVLDALLEAMPQSRMVAVRYPRAKLGVYRDMPTDTLTADVAHSGTPRARTAFHNDCFLATADDMGTFTWRPSEERKYWESESAYLAMGGETCKLSEFCEVPNAMRDFAAYHWSYLNTDYHPDVLSKWERENFYDEILRRLGYRLTATKLEYEVSGNKVDVSVDIENSGWAAPFNPRTVRLILKPKKGGETLEADIANADPRRWLPGITSRINHSFELPANAPKGEYEVLLALPDSEPTLSNKPEYAIRLAGAKNAWRGKKGQNYLATIKIK